MALFPCEIHLARYKGPSSSAYPAILINGQSFRKKVRACEPCLTAKIDESPVRLTLLDPEHPEAYSNNGDHSCSKHPRADATAAFFLTTYRRGQSEEAYYAPICDGCASALTEQWGLE